MRLIDADELLTAFPVDNEPMVTKSCIRMTIQHMPTIEPKQGWWIYAGTDHDGTWYLKCSECLGEVENKIYPHCPYCLARMERADDE